jgi:hypothetical protein
MKNSSRNCPTTVPTERKFSVIYKKIMEAANHTSSDTTKKKKWSSIPSSAQMSENYYSANITNEVKEKKPSLMFVAPIFYISAMSLSVITLR